MDVNEAFEKWFKVNVNFEGSADGDKKMQAAVKQLCQEAYEADRWQPIDDRALSGDAVLIRTRLGCVEAWFHEGASEWVCLDDRLSLSKEEALKYQPIPK